MSSLLFVKILESTDASADDQHQHLITSGGEEDGAFAAGEVNDRRTRSLAGILTWDGHSLFTHQPPPSIAPADRQ